MSGSERFEVTGFVIRFNWNLTRNFDSKKWANPAARRQKVTPDLQPHDLFSSPSGRELRLLERVSDLVTRLLLFLRLAVGIDERVLLRYYLGPCMIFLAVGAVGFRGGHQRRMTRICYGCSEFPRFDAFPEFALIELLTQFWL